MPVPAQPPAHRALHFLMPWSHHPFVQDHLHFQRFCGVKSQLITKRKQTECAKEVSSGHRGRDEEQVSGTASLFPWKATTFEKCCAGSFCSTEVEFGQARHPLLMALVSRVCYWKGRLAAVSGREQKGSESPGVQGHLTSPSLQPSERSSSLTLQLHSQPQRG